MQAVIRALLSLEMEVHLLDPSSVSDAYGIVDLGCADSLNSRRNITFQLENNPPSCETPPASGHNYLDHLRTHTIHLLSSMKEALSRCDAVLMDISGYRQHLGPSSTTSSDLGTARTQLIQGKVAFDLLESDILNSMELPTSPLHDEHAVKLLIFARHVRKATANVEALVDQVESMKRTLDRPRVHIPSYPIWKAVHRTNAQVRHDRGGLTAGYYEKTFADIAKLFDKIKSLEHKPVSEAQDTVQRRDSASEKKTSSVPSDRADGPAISTQRKLRYKIWRTLYYLQGFESKYAFKVCLVTSLLSVPAYLTRTHTWWNEYEVWWAAAMSWTIMHPRVGGNVQDLVTRSGVAMLGAFWSGLGYAVGRGNPYITGVFAALYMAPMLYRYTISSHPVCPINALTLRH